MAIESQCTGCGKRLRVGDEHAGKAARCPACGNIYTVPTTSAAGGESTGAVVGSGEHAWAAPPVHETWFMQTPDQQIYGPVTRPELDEWVRQGRIAGDCRLRRGTDGPWQWAWEIYGVLAQPANPFQAGNNPFADAPLARPVGSPGGFAPQPMRYLPPHRGGMILAFGILAWMVCPIFGFLAWWMGNQDLKAMNQGRMDPNGRTMTQAGQVLGMIYSILCLIGIVFVLFTFFAVIAANM